ncbi:MAG: hypothetical protein WA778_20780, partial [Pseudolabrys sp.]
IDDCTIGELGGKPAFVDWGGLRDWLRKHSTVPTSDRFAVIKEIVCTENLNPDVVVMKSAKDWV